jgi:glycosyltransferase involved in cell wall biosynthesis
VLLLCQHFYPEMISTGKLMTELAGALTHRGWRIEVVCAQPSLVLAGENLRVPSDLTYEGIHVKRVGALGSHRTLLSRAMFAATYSAASLARGLRGSRGARGVVLTTNPPFLGLVAWLLRKIRALPYVLIVHDVYPEIAVRLGVVRSGSFAERLWERMSRLMLNEAASVVVIGRDMQKLILAKMRPDRQARVQCIPNWSDELCVSPVPVERNRFARENGLGGRFVVQYSGRMGRTHNLEPLLEAAELLKDEPMVFQFVGDGAKREELYLNAQSRRLSNVVFLPYQPNERLGELLSAADISVVCLESQFTGLSVPSKTYGVMAAGRPILAFVDPESEIGRTILENDCGMVLPDPTGRAVADALLTLLHDRVRLAQMASRSRAAFLRDYTLDRASERYDACLSSAF